MGKEFELNVVLLPPREIGDAAIDTSRKLRESFKTLSVLDGKNTFPHITLYQARFPEKATDAIRAYLKTIAGKNAPFEVSLGRFSSFYRSIWWEAQLTNEILHLSKAVIYQLNALRQGLVIDFWKNGKWNMSETYSIQNYGSVLMSESFLPHIMIATLENAEDVQPALRAMRPRVAKFVASKMHLGVLGKFGTVTEILEEFPFAGGSPYMLKPQNYF